MAIGKPVVGANIAGIPELVKDNRSGFIYKYDDINDLADKMRILFEDRNLAEEFGKNAKMDAKELYAMDIYENLIEGKRN